MALSLWKLWVGLVSFFRLTLIFFWVMFSCHTFYELLIYWEERLHAAFAAWIWKLGSDAASLCCCVTFKVVRASDLSHTPSRCARWCHLEDQGLSWVEQNSVYYASGPAQANIGVKYTLGDLNTCISIENLLERIWSILRIKIDCCGQGNPE